VYAHKVCPRLNYTRAAAHLEGTALCMCVAHLYCNLVSELKIAFLSRVLCACGGKKYVRKGVERALHFIIYIYGVGVDWCGGLSGCVGESNRVEFAL
jgi:hypothetical protein